MLKTIPIVEYFELESIYYKSLHKSKAVQFAKIVQDRKAWVANHDGLYDSIFYPMAKALNARRADIKSHNNGEWENIWAFFPIVVLSGDIYELDTSKKEMTPELCQYITFSRELKSKSISGHYSVDFVTQRHLVDFIKNNILPAMRHLKDKMIASPELFLHDRTSK